MEPFEIILLCIIGVLVALCVILAAAVLKTLRNADKGSDTEKVITSACAEVTRLVSDEMKKELSVTRSEITRTVSDMQSGIYKSINEGTRTTNEIQTSQITKLTTAVNESLKSLSSTVDTRMESIRTAVEQKMSAMQQENSKKLDEMRGIVDEKLQKTINDRMTQSFKMVNDNLEALYKGMGEVQTLASGVVDLKKILANVKTRGIFGEVQLDRILGQVLTPDQYDVNVRTKQNSSDPVEFAVKLPSKDSDTSFIYLPIDAKFPLDKYTALLDAYDTADAAAQEKMSKELETFIKNNAKKIQEKYIDPPHTTNFAIMFLPTEGLYSETVKRPGLFEYLQREYNVTVTGPSTISAFLNSLQMGFRTLAIQKRSSEVWSLLGAVKTEFGKFNDILTNVRKRIGAVDSDLDKLIGTRTNTIMRRLRTVQELPQGESASLLSGETDDTPDDDTPEESDII